MVLVYFDIGITDFTMVIRKVFHYAIAHFASIKRQIAVFYCRNIAKVSADNVKRFLHNILFSIFAVFIFPSGHCTRDCERTNC